MNKQPSPRTIKANARSLHRADECTRPAAESPLTDRHGAARYLHLCPRSVDNYARQGKLPIVKFGARVLFRIADLDQLIAANVRRAGAVATEATT